MISTIYSEKLLSKLYDKSSVIRCDASSSQIHAKYQYWVTLWNKERIKIFGLALHMSWLISFVLAYSSCETNELSDNYKMKNACPQCSNQKQSSRHWNQN